CSGPYPWSPRPKSFGGAGAARLPLSAGWAGSALRMPACWRWFSSAPCCRSEPMNLIEEAAKRLRQLEAAGVTRTSHAPHDGAQPRLAPAEPGKRPLEPRPGPARTLDLARL